MGKLGVTQCSVGAGGRAVPTGALGALGRMVLAPAAGARKWQINRWD